MLSSILSLYSLFYIIVILCLLLYLAFFLYYRHLILVNILIFHFTLFFSFGSREIVLHVGHWSCTGITQNWYQVPRTVPRAPKSKALASLVVAPKQRQIIFIFTWVCSLKRLLWINCVWVLKYYQLSVDRITSLSSPRPPLGISPAPFSLTFN